MNFLFLRHFIRIRNLIFVYKSLKISLDFIFFLFTELDIFGSSIVSREYGLQIGIPGKEWIAIAECEDRSRRIFADSGEFFELLFIPRKYSVILCTHDIRSFQQIPRSRVVAESLIVWEELIIVCFCEMSYGRIPVEHFLIKRNHTISLGLLEEDLSEPDMIPTRIMSVILPPREVVSSVFSIPVEEELPREGFHRVIVFVFLLFAKKDHIRYNDLIS